VDSSFCTRAADVSRSTLHSQRARDEKFIFGAESDRARARLLDLAGSWSANPGRVGPAMNPHGWVSHARSAPVCVS
jgi:hypothetical protein